MPGIFITATGTDVGKTYVTAAILRAGLSAGLPMDGLKPILTGFDPDDDAQSSDAHVIAAAMGQTDPHAIAQIAPWRYAAPLSPNMAAAAEGRRIDLDAITATCRAALRPDRLTLIEGVGGVMVPLNERHTILDLIAALALPTVLVTETKLGALSHCLTAVASLRMRGRTPALLVVNESAASTVPFEETMNTLTTFCPRIPCVAMRRGAAEHDGLLLLERIRALVSPIRPRPGFTLPTK